MKELSRMRLKLLIKSAYNIASDLMLKDKERISYKELDLLNAVNQCAENGIGEKSVDDVGREVDVFTNRAYVGTFGYHEIFGKRDVVSTGTVITLDEKSYVVLTVMLKSDKAISLEVN